MSDYLPEKLSQKWEGKLDSILHSVRALWERSKPRRTWFSFGPPERDLRDDEMNAMSAKQALLYRGRLVWGHFARAYFPAYVPGRRTHYGSVVYSEDEPPQDSIFHVAWRVNLLRERQAIPAGAEAAAAAIRNDRSSFNRMKLPPSVGVDGRCYFANICIHRTRLPLGYLHDRCVPILIAPADTEACCIVPLRFWTRELREVWSGGPPAYDPELFRTRLTQHNIEP